MQLSEEKLAAIRALFAHSDWDWDPEVEEEVPATTSEATLDSVPNPIIPPQPSSVECPDCLCRPCVIAEDNRQSWWPDQPKSASRKNRHGRKDLYKKFWSMICHRGAWNDERYKERKSRAIQLDIRRKQFVWQAYGTKREIMPNCVIHQVREWLPNVGGQPYMGHMLQ